MVLLTGLLLGWAYLGQSGDPAGGLSRNISAPTPTCAHTDSQPRAVGLFGTLPIYWNEAAELADYLSRDQASHWARGVLEYCHTIRNLDSLAPEGTGNKGESGLGGLRYLLMAQPRVLAPAENVALDDWVRAGGRLLLFADPMLTAHSIHPLGDQRRPADVVILSPILARWGLRLEFDEDQPPAERMVSVAGVRVPVDMAGTLVPEAGGGPDTTCHLFARGLAAQCRIGKGHVLILADSALLDEDGANPAVRIAAFEALLDRGFSD